MCGRRHRRQHHSLIMAAATALLAKQATSTASRPLMQIQPNPQHNMAQISGTTSGGIPQGPPPAYDQSERSMQVNDEKFEHEERNVRQLQSQMPSAGTSVPTGYRNPSPVYGNSAPVYGNPAPVYANSTPLYGNSAPVYAPSTTVYGLPLSDRWAAKLERKELKAAAKLQRMADRYAQREIRGYY